MRILALVFCVLGLTAPTHPAQAADKPIRYADTEAELTLTRVSARTLAVQLSPLGSDGAPAQPPSSNILVDHLEESVWSGRTLDAPVRRSVGDLTVEIQPNPLSVTVRRADSSVVQRLSWPEADSATHFRTDAPVYGLGQGGPQFDRRGHRFPMADGWGAYKRPTHGSRVAVPVLIGVDGWSLFVHHPMSEENVFDLRAGHGEFRPGPKARKKTLKLFVTAWEEPAQALSEYTRIAGDTPMPPKWTLGYMQSHRTLDGPEQIREVAQTFREKNLPADGLIYLGRFTPPGWNTEDHPWQFNPETFTNPEAILGDLHALDFKVALHTYGGPEGLHDTSMEAPTTDSNHIANYWRHHTPLVETGIDAWWPDGGERLSSEGRLARHRMYRLGPLSEAPNERPWSFHRTGYSGAHRYGGWMWSGDVASTWKTLEEHVQVGINASLSTSPFWGADIGGFYPTTDEFTSDLYARWFQFGAFTPIFRAHGRVWHTRLPWGWNPGEMGPLELVEYQNGTTSAPDTLALEPDTIALHNPDIEPIARRYLELRYRLMPYLYTAVRQAHDTGLPIMRALWLHYPNDSLALRQDDQYLWGLNMLVAPVVRKGVTTKEVYLPGGRGTTSGPSASDREIRRSPDTSTSKRCPSTCGPGPSSP